MTALDVVFSYVDSKVISNFHFCRRLHKMAYELCAVLLKTLIPSILTFGRKSIMQQGNLTWFCENNSNRLMKEKSISEQRIVKAAIMTHSDSMGKCLV
jgi:hypothetical protein